tara:strand:- start:170 stop:571 length:402 start_codon:yes stop_codon:yes gene_type:complete
MKLGDKNYLEINLLETQNGAYQTGDVLFLISVSSNGFIAQSEVWIEKDQLEIFSNDIIKIDRENTGSAKILSMSPGEFELEIKSVGNRGYFSISGQLEKNITDVISSLTFQFLIESSYVSQLVNENWVNENCA